MAATYLLMQSYGHNAGSSSMLTQRRRQRAASDARGAAAAARATRAAAADRLRTKGAAGQNYSRWQRSAWSADGKLLRTREERRMEAQYGRYKAAAAHGPVLDQDAFAKKVPRSSAAKARRRRKKWKHQRGAPQHSVRRSQARRRAGRVRLEAHEAEVAIEKENAAIVAEHPVASPRSICSYDSVAMRMVEAEQRRVEALAADIARRDREASKPAFEKLLVSCTVSHGVVLAAKNGEEVPLHDPAKFSGGAAAMARLLRGMRVTKALARVVTSSDGTPRSTGGESACSWRSNQLPYPAGGDSDGTQIPNQGRRQEGSDRAPRTPMAKPTSTQQGGAVRRPASAPAARPRRRAAGGAQAGIAPPLPAWQRRKRDELAARSRARAKLRQQKGATRKPGLPPRAPKPKKYAAGRNDTDAPAAVVRRRERERRLRERRERAWRDRGASYVISEGSMKRVHIGVPVQELGEEEGKGGESSTPSENDNDSVPGYAYDSDLRDDDARRRRHGRDEWYPEGS